MFLKYYETWIEYCLPILFKVEYLVCGRRTSYRSFLAEERVTADEPVVVAALHKPFTAFPRIVADYEVETLF